MKKYAKFSPQLLLIASACLLNACAMPSLTKAQCLTGDWHGIGYNDGVAGRYPNYISEHQQACAETGVIPDFTAWEAGRKQGLAHYCTAANAKHLGLSGRSLNAVCPANQANRLQSIHDKAYRKYQRQQEIARDERKLARYERELRQLRRGEMLDFATESEAREYMLEIQQEIFDLRQKIRNNRRADSFN